MSSHLASTAGVAGARGAHSCSFLHARLGTSHMNARIWIDQDLKRQLGY